MHLPSFTEGALEMAFPSGAGSLQALANFDLPSSLEHAVSCKQVCTKQMLQPDGEIAAVASGFDVIAFSNGPVSWGACYEGHLHLLEGASKPLQGRQNGRRAFRPNSASTGCTRVQVETWLPTCTL